MLKTIQIRHWLDSDLLEDKTGSSLPSLVRCFNCGDGPATVLDLSPVTFGNHPRLVCDECHGAEISEGAGGAP